MKKYQMIIYTNNGNYYTAEEDSLYKLGMEDARIQNRILKNNEEYKTTKWFIYDKRKKQYKEMSWGEINEK